MTNYLLLHGAASDGWLWHRVETRLRAAGHRSYAPDLPCADPDADLLTWVDVASRAATEAFGDEPVVVVAQSLSGLVAPVVVERRPVAELILVAPMIPIPGERGADWWEATGQAEAQKALLDELGHGDADPLDPEIVFCHDLDPETVAESVHHTPDQQAGPLLTPNPIERWPDTPTRVLAAVDDRLFPFAFVQRLARERLGLDVVPVAGGHLAVLSHPEEVAGAILAGSR